MKWGDFMKAQQKDLIMQNKVFGILAALTAIILSIPLFAMQYQWVKPDPSNPLDQGVNWTLMDFVFMGILIFGAGSLFIAIARVAPQKFRLLIGVLVVAAFVLTWAHLAVGLVDSWPLAGS